MADRRTLLQSKGESYEKHDDTPTVTFVTSGDSLTLPYHALQWIRRNPGDGSLRLQIDAFRINLHGERLSALWRDLQLFRVRVIRERSEHAVDSPKGGVRKIEIIDPEEPAAADEE